MARYEYTVLEFEAWNFSVEFEKDLNAYGAQGWKVVGTGGGGAGSDYGSDILCWVILMREK